MMRNSFYEAYSHNILDWAVCERMKLFLFQEQPNARYAISISLESPANSLDRFSEQHSLETYPLIFLSLLADSFVQA